MSEEAPSNPSGPAKPPSRRGPPSASRPSIDAALASSADGPHPVPAAPTLNLSESTTKHSMDRATLDEVTSPTGATTPNPFGIRAGTLELDDYFVSWP